MNAIFILLIMQDSENSLPLSSVLQNTASGVYIFILKPELTLLKTSVLKVGNRNLLDRGCLLTFSTMGANLSPSSSVQSFASIITSALNLCSYRGAEEVAVLGPLVLSKAITKEATAKGLVVNNHLVNA